MPYPIKVNTEMDPSSIIKFADIQLDIEDMKMLEKLICYLKMLQQVCRVKGFVFVDLSSYYEKEELRELIKAGLYCDLCLLFIETTEYFRIDECNMIIIDKDNCVIQY